MNKLRNFDIKKNVKKLPHSESFITISSSIMLILIGLFVGLIILLLINANHAFTGFLTIIGGGLNDGIYGLGAVIATSATLIMVGLSVAFAFKTGLFNIGVAGQYVVGAFFALYAAIVLKLPWYLCIISGTIGGAIWGFIPGFFKAIFNVNEVITSIMFNWIGLYLVNELIYNRGSDLMYDQTQTKTYNLRKYFPNAVIPDLGISNLFGGSRTLTIGIIIAIIMAIIIWVILRKTTFGYELKACGFNKHASKYAGINEKKSIILSMIISGGLAGMGASLHYLSGIEDWNPLNSVSLPIMGFNGIPVALLASLNPIGTIFASLFIAHITKGGGFLPTQFYSREIADVITGIIIYLCAFSLFFKTYIRKRIVKKEEDHLNDVDYNTYEAKVIETEDKD